MVVSQKTVRLNLGCGNTILDGYENYDKYPLNDKVKYIELNNLPLPFDDGSVDEILLSHIIEHLTVEKILFFEDILRILKNGGKVIIKLPTFSPNIAHTSFYHDSEYFSCFTIKNYEKNSLFATQQVMTISLQKNGLNVKRGIQRVIKFFIGMFYTEIEWNMKKL